MRATEINRNRLKNKVIEPGKGPVGLPEINKTPNRNILTLMNSAIISLNFDQSNNKK
jgi:hypothetical protein